MEPRSFLANDGYPANIPTLGTQYFNPASVRSPPALYCTEYSKNLQGGGEP